MIVDLAASGSGRLRASAQTRSVRRTDAAREEVPGELRDLVRLFVQREMAGIKDVDLGVSNIASVRPRARHDEGEDSTGRDHRRLKDIQARNKEGHAVYRKYRDTEVPIYSAPPGLATV